MTHTDHTPAHPRLPWIITATSFGFAIVQLDVSIVNLGLPHIGADLDTEVAGLQWVVDAYTLLFAALLLSAGAIGDGLGAKRVFIAGFVLFAAASLACGLAPSAAVLIGARAVQGVGAAMLVPPSLALLTHACGDDHQKRAHAIGLWTAVSGAAIAVGPVLGGFLIEAFGWRSIFLVNLPLAALGIALTWHFVPETPRNGQGSHLDLIGQALAVLALLGLIAAIIESGSLGLTSPIVWALLALGIGGFAAFLAVEARTASPMLPLHFFRNRTFSTAVIAGTFLNLAYYGVIFVLSLYLQQVRHYGVILAGLAFLPLTATFIVFNINAGRVAGRIGARIPMVVGALVAAGGYLLLRLLGVDTPYWWMVPGFMMIPAGMGTAVPAMTTALLGSVERQWSGTASGVLNTTRQAGGAIGVAAFGALVGQQHERIVAGLHLAGMISGGLLIVVAAVAFAGVRNGDAVKNRS
jgi:DHA2 family methylenomycin A resistance protein-like MFS transporter